MVGWGERQKGDREILGAADREIERWRDMERKMGRYEDREIETETGNER